MSRNKSSLDSAVPTPFLLPLGIARSPAEVFQGEEAGQMEVVRQLNLPH